MDTNIEIGESIYWYVNNDWIYSKNNNWPITLKGNNKPLVVLGKVFVYHKTHITNGLMADTRTLHLMN